MGHRVSISTTWAAIIASLLVHAGAGVALWTAPMMASGERPKQPPSRVVLLDLSDRDRGKVPVNERREPLVPSPRAMKPLEIENVVPPVTEPIPQPPKPETAVKPSAPEPMEVPIGDAESRTKPTENFLQDKSATGEHRAREGKSDQASLTPNPGVKAVMPPGEAGQPSKPTPPSAPEQPQPETQTPPRATEPVPATAEALKPSAAPIDSKDKPVEVPRPEKPGVDKANKPGESKDPAEREAVERREAMPAQSATTPAIPLGPSAGPAPMNPAASKVEAKPATPEVVPVLPITENRPALSEPAKAPSATNPESSKGSTQPDAAKPAATSERRPVTPPTPPVNAGNAGSPTPVVGDAGVQSDRESDAFSIRRSAEYRQGKIDVGEGLELRTKKPQISLTTQLTVTPRPMLIRFSLNKTGKVIAAKIIEHSGNGEIDEQVLGAIFAWTASGRLLAELPDDPRAKIDISLRFYQN